TIQAGHRLSAADVSDKIKRFSKGDVCACVTLTARRASWTLQRNTDFAYRFDRFARHRRLPFLNRTQARIGPHPFGFKTGSLQNPYGGIHDLRANAIAWDNGYSLFCHLGILAKLSFLSACKIERTLSFLRTFPL